MTGPLGRRLARLEQTVSPARTVHVWAGTETLADTIARRFPDGTPDAVTVLAYRWAGPDQAAADSRR